MRVIKKIKFDNISLFKNQLLNWAQSYDELVWLDSNQHRENYTEFDAVLAVDALSYIKTDYKSAFSRLEDYRNSVSDWIFGYLAYDLKNDLENLQSNNFDAVNFPDLYFFHPKKIFMFNNNDLIISYVAGFENLIREDLENIKKISIFNNSKNYSPKLTINERINKSEYISKVKKLRDHIQRGDIYEVNFCKEYFSHGNIDPLKTFLDLQSISKPPFSVYLKNNFLYLLSASPERYLKKQGDLIVSQPIKGTARRSSNIFEDKKLREKLFASPKERSENVMIVDLVRNDLSRIATKGSVKVEELHKTYTFEQVHHLISTVKAVKRAEVSVLDVITKSFPMGSMTGAPKISAMKIIERIEKTKRGLYSGAVGYFSPDNNFDFNVVIRSILYNAKNSYVSFSVGSAITIDSDPVKEYEECLVKAEAMRSVLEN